MWFDHVVLAKDYIGPINAGSVVDTVQPAGPTTIGVKSGRSPASADDPLERRLQRGAARVPGVTVRH